MQNQNATTKKKKKKSNRLSSPHSSEFSDQKRLDDLDQRKLEPSSHQQWRERMREAESKSREKKAEQE